MNGFFSLIAFGRDDTEAGWKILFSHPWLLVQTPLRLKYANIMSCSIHSMSHCESTLGPNCARLMPMPICSDVRFQGSHLSECLTFNHAEQWEDTFLFRISTATVADDYDASARGRLPIHRLRLMWLSCHFFFSLEIRDWIAAEWVAQSIRYSNGQMSMGQSRKVAVCDI